LGARNQGTIQPPLPRRAGRGIKNGLVGKHIILIGTKRTS
jgi:hypothetical protein